MPAFRAGRSRKEAPAPLRLNVLARPRVSAVLKPSGSEGKRKDRQQAPLVGRSKEESLYGL